MRLFIFLAAMMLPAGSSAVEPSVAPPAAPRAIAQVDANGDPDRDCPADRNLHLARDPKSRGLQPLGELPPGDLALTVLRQVDGCHEPAIVRYGVGGELSGGRGSSADRP